MPGEPTPSPDSMTAWYWNQAAQERLVVSRCRVCGTFHFYPRPICPNCGAHANFEWVVSSGRGSVYSFSIVRRPPSEAFADRVPYAVCIIALDEGVHLMSNLVNCALVDVKIGARVQVTYKDLSNGLKLPIFEVETSAERQTKT